MSALASSIPSPALAASWPAWSARATDRCQKRVAIFVRRGMAEGSAEHLVDRLVDRDHDRDDRHRCCVECKHLQRDAGCFAARQGWLSGTSKAHTPVVDILQRCERFELQIT